MKQKKGTYIAIGIAIGTAVGVATDNIALWLSLGIAIGVALDNKSHKNQKHSTNEE